MKTRRRKVSEGKTGWTDPEGAEHYGRGATGCHVTLLMGAGTGHAGLTGQGQESDFIQGKIGSP